MTHSDRTESTSCSCDWQLCIKLSSESQVPGSAPGPKLQIVCLGCLGASCPVVPPGIIILVPKKQPGFVKKQPGINQVYKNTARFLNKINQAYKKQPGLQKSSARFTENQLGVTNNNQEKSIRFTGSQPEKNKPGFPKIHQV